jgi:hypothetical protein
MPSLQFPDILAGKAEARQEEDSSGLSCAEMAVMDEQGLSINHAVASAGAALLMKMLVTGDLQHHCVYVSTEFGTSLTYNSPRIIRKYLKACKFKPQEERDETDEFIREEHIDRA